MALGIHRYGGGLKEGKEGRVFHIQKSLPDLPLPELDATLFRYLSSVRPLVSEEQFNKTFRLALDFAEVEGPELYGHLLTRAKEKSKLSSPTSWLREWWDEYVYMRPRHNVTIMDSYYYNFGLSVPDVLPSTDFIPQSILKSPEFPMIARAAALVLGALEFKYRLEKGLIPPEKSGAREQCMEMFGRLFNSCRIPRDEIDDMITYHGHPSDTNHVFVIVRDHFYLLDVSVAAFDETGNYSLAPLRDVISQLYAILKDAETLSTATPVGLLSCQQRPVWARDRRDLLSISENNRAIIRAIESSAFGLCLDKCRPSNLDDMDTRLWHNNGHGRWYDKPIQFVVFEDGTAGLHGEHSGLDGMVSKLLTDFVSVLSQKKLSDMKAPHATVSANMKMWTRVTFDVNSHIKERLISAKNELQKEIDKIDHKCLVFTEFGSDKMKNQQCSPDALVQMTIQLAFYRTYGHLPAHYESAATRIYRHGRTETIRVSSMESLRFVKAIGQNSPSAETASLLRLALARQSTRTRDASNGFGVDRLFLGLRLIHKERYPQKEMPKFFHDPTYQYSISWRMSTSQLGGDHFTTGYGAVVDDGLGVCYSYTKNTVHFKVSTRHLTGTTPHFFVGQLEKSLRDIMSVLVANPIAKPKAKL